MDIKRPSSTQHTPAQTSTATPAPTASQQQLAELKAATSTATVENMTDMERHVAGFADLALSKQKGAATVTAASTQQVLEALGLRVESSGVFDMGAKVDKAGGAILTGLFAKRQGHPDHVETARLAEVGVRDAKEGVLAHSGIFGKDGNINPKEAAAWWHETAGKKGVITKADVERYLNGPGVDLGLFSLRKPGKALNALEFHLLFDVAAVVDKSGERVLTPDRFLAFLDGSLWKDLAAARAEGKLYEPVKTGVAVHDSTKKVASEMAKLTARYGGSTDAGTQALHQAQLNIDVDASLKYQQSQKTLLPTIFGAVRALCPVGGGSGMKSMKPAEA